MSPATTGILVRSETFLPFATGDVWPRLPEAVNLPAEAHAREEERLLAWKYGGTRGWLPVEDPLAQLRLWLEPGGTRVSLRLEARSAPEVAALVRMRLDSYATGHLAALTAAVRRSVRPRGRVGSPLGRSA